MTIDMVVNLALIFFVATPIAILVAGNLGYMAAHFFAVGAFVLLRKDGQTGRGRSSCPRSGSR